MVSKTYSVAFSGQQPKLITVECSVTPGLPGFSIVGLPDKAVSEARERIKASFANMHLSLPAKKVTVNLAPADIPKIGACYDLPIALAVLEAIEALPEGTGEGLISLGELSLSGSLKAVRGILPASLVAVEMDKTLICPSEQSAEGAWVEHGFTIAARNLHEVLNHLLGHHQLLPVEHIMPQAPVTELCFSQVKGQEIAKRALEIAAAGRHHMLMIGPPGAGKSMLAERLRSILPPMDAQERLETSIIYSLAGQQSDAGLLGERPFLAPHHTASAAALVGGGKNAGPGQVSMAHHGVLFLDEMPEFSRDVLDALREPLETRRVTIARAQHSHTYDSDFMLLAAANPCRCWNDGGTCAQGAQCSRKYLSRISGPMMDRIDMRINVEPVSLRDLQTPRSSGQTSKLIADRVAAARIIQANRYQNQPNIWFNGQADSTTLDRCATPTSEGAEILSRLSEKNGLSARGYYRLLRVARTIADLEGATDISRAHISEAVAYRVTGA